MTKSIYDVYDSRYNTLVETRTSLIRLEKEFRQAWGMEDYVCKKLTRREFDENCATFDPELQKAMMTLMDQTVETNQFFREENYRINCQTYGREISDRMFPLQEDGATRGKAADYKELRDKAFAGKLRKMSRVSECLNGMAKRPTYAEVLKKGL